MRKRGAFSAINSGVNPQSEVGAPLYSGRIESGSYMFKGVGGANSHFNGICGITPFVLDEVTVWGQCREEVIINFETEEGITGTSTGTVVCV